MKKSLIIALLATIPVATWGQSAISGYNLYRNDMRGTARFMSMAGAFSALGGDLSTLNQNPAGLGIYRSSEIGATLDINVASTSAGNVSTGNTFVNCNNFGYAGTAFLDNSGESTFSWGATYNRTASFDRSYRGGFSSLATSMSNYIANFSNSYSPEVLGETDSYNPFQKSSADWLSIMAYNSYLINPTASQTYNGLFGPITSGNAQFEVKERGYVDEYSIDFAGNVMNTVYWGIGFGIDDISFRQDSYYDEELTDANVYNPDTKGTSRGNSYFKLGNHLLTTGNGFNVKMGVILKPVNEFRVGLAIHTPTWYNLSTNYYSTIDYSNGYNLNAQGEPTSNNDGNYNSDEAYYQWRMKSPWRLIAGMAGVIGGRYIISADYEFAGVNNLSLSAPSGYDSYESLTDVNTDVKNYFRATNTVRVGGEMRVTRQFSLRAGYSFTTSSIKDNVNANTEYIYTDGTNPAYTFNKQTNYVTLGCGYRGTSGLYADIAYVLRSDNATYHAFSPFSQNNTWMGDTPTSSLKTTNNNIVLSVGYKF